MNKLSDEDIRRIEFLLLNHKDVKKSFQDKFKDSILEDVYLIRGNLNSSFSGNRRNFDGMAEALFQFQTHTKLKGTKRHNFKFKVNCDIEISELNIETPLLWD